MDKADIPLYMGIRESIHTEVLLSQVQNANKSIKI
jgi:hypothetical protein